jgi:hypothetical protein
MAMFNEYVGGEVAHSLENPGQTIALAAVGGLAFRTAARATGAAVRGVTRGRGFTFRGDSRAPSQIFNEGFAARGSSTDLFAHALDNTRPPSAFVSTSRSSGVAANFADNVFVVRPRGGIDVNRALGRRSPFPDELEVAVPFRIAPKDVRAVTIRDKGLSILNPNYRP